MTLTIDRAGEQVAAYETLGGAAMAVAHLRSVAPGAAEVAIEPAGVEPLADPAEPTRWRVAVATGAASGVVAAASAAALVWSRNGLAGTRLALFVAVGLLAGLVMALVAAGSDRRRAGRSDRADTLRASGFVLLVRRGDAATARHLLARWWDPRAHPLMAGARTARD
jgi:hypothetical protein